MRDLADLALNLAEKRLRGEDVVEIGMLRRVMQLGDMNNRVIHEMERKRTNNFEEVRKVVRAAPKEIGQTGVDGTGVIEAEFVDEDDEKPKKRKWRRK